MLKSLVHACKLPPLAERLPQNPMVVTPLTEVGKYGGTWRSAIVGGGSLSMLFRYQAYEPLTGALQYGLDRDSSERRGSV